MRKPAREKKIAQPAFLPMIVIDLLGGLGFCFWGMAAFLSESNVAIIVGTILTMLGLLFLLCAMWLKSRTYSSVMASMAVHTLALLFFLVMIAIMTIIWLLPVGPNSGPPWYTIAGVIGMGVCSCLLFQSIRQLNYLDALQRARVKKGLEDELPISTGWDEAPKG